jgi:hypothetical protein
MRSRIPGFARLYAALAAQTRVRWNKNRGLHELIADRPAYSLCGFLAGTPKN